MQSVVSTSDTTEMPACLSALREFWQDAQAHPHRVHVSLPSQAADELRRLAATAEIADWTIVSTQLSDSLRNAIDDFGLQLVAGPGVMVLDAVEGLGPRQRQAAIWILANGLGEPLVQDSAGSRLIHVYDRDRTQRMAHGARYHQTREGGSLHTDNVNMPDHWEFLVFGCVEPAMLGGETILAHGHLVHELLDQVAPEALAALREPFWWEYRGIADAQYQAPIITYDELGRPHYRYLRPYLQSAHEKVGQPLTERQSWALDVLDSAMDLGRMQLRLTLAAGEILVTDDSRILHGRTSFADHFETTTIAEYTDESGRPLRRSFERSWVKQRTVVAQLPQLSTEGLMMGHDSVPVIS